MIRRAFVCSLCSLLIACGGAAAAPPARSVSLRMKGTPPHATVTIDDIHVGPLDVVAKRGIGLPAGKHRITIEAPGYFPYDKLITAEEAPVALDVALVPIPE